MRSLDLLKPHIPNTFGTAGWLTKAEALHRDLNQRGEGSKLCPYIGALPDLDRENSNATMIYARRADQLLEGARRTEGIREGSGHLITFAPTRAGKGTGQIIPNLLTWQGSTLVIDVKGENYKYSAGHRKDNLKQNVIRFAPFEDVSDRWNPIMSIRADPKNPHQTPEEEEDVRYLTNLLIAPTGNDGDKFWENSAKNFLEGLLLHVRIAPLHAASALDMKQPEEECQVTERNMREVRRLLTLGEEAFKCLLDSMQGSTRTLVKQAGSTLSKLMKGEGRTGLSILSVALEQTSVWAYSRLQNVTYAPGGQEGADPSNEATVFQG